MEANAKARSRGRGRPRRDEAPDADEIGRVAIAAFASRGFDGASLRDVAAAANVDAALLSRRYGSKLGLWRASVDAIAERMGTMLAKISEAMDSPAPFSQVYRDALRQFVEFSAVAPELGRFFTNEINAEGERRDYVYDRIWRPSYSVLRPLLERARREGLCRTASADLLVFVLIGAVAMPFMMQSFIADEIGIGEADLAGRLGDEIKNLFAAPTGGDAPGRSGISRA